MITTFSRHLAHIAAIAAAAFTACGSGNPANADPSDSIALEEIAQPPIVDTIPSPSMVSLLNPLPSLQAPMYLSGNFGELRNNHFHSGLDFKTGGRTGLKVVASDSGYVSRIYVSPWGFGRAVYVTHPHTGLTTVYGHLESFAPAIDAVAREEQYENEAFDLDLYLAPGKIPVARGEMIGRSGNAGSSGGPHLHMDVRLTKSEDPIDPMPYFRHLLRDNAAPEMRKLSLFAEPGEGVVEGPSSFLPAKKPYSFTAWGKVYPGIKAYDRMTGTQNIYGVKHLALTVDGDTIYRRTVDRFSFDATRAVHTLIHNPSLRRSGEWIMVTRIPEANPLDRMITTDCGGIIDIDAERTYACKFILKDEFGNVATVPFTIRGKRAPIPPRKGGEAYSFRKPFIITSGPLKVAVPPMARYDTRPFEVSAEKSSGFLTDIFTIGDREEHLHLPIDIEIAVACDTIADPRQLTLVRLSGKNKSAVASRYENGKIKASIKNLGKYALTLDRRPPTITKLKTTRGKLAYKIADNLSGIESYRGTIDGKFALFELDGKTGRLTFDIDRHIFPSTGKSHKIEITVEDAAGNSAVLNDSVVF